MIDRNLLIARLAAKAEKDGTVNDALRAYREKLHGMGTVALGNLYRTQIKDDPYSPKAKWEPEAAAA